MADALANIRTLQEAVVYFSNKENAFNYIVNKRWPNGVVCPHCGCPHVGFLQTQQRWKCKNRECRKQFSVKSGTIMEDSPLGLDKWLIAIWLIVNAKNGISSCEIARSMGITQKSAWFLLHRIRLAMQTGSFTKLSGEVEADETYVGGKARFMHADKKKEKIKGTGVSGKTIVLGALERSTEKGKSKVRAGVIKSTDRVTLKREIESIVEKGSTLYTDAHNGYDDLNAEFVRLVIDHAQKYVDGKITTNGIENFWTLLKRSLKGTYVSVEPFHLFRYLDEQSFRFNFRSETDQQRFIEALTLIEDRRITYKQLTGKIEEPEVVTTV
jgi:transposase-like protein